MQVLSKSSIQYYVILDSTVCFNRSISVTIWRPSLALCIQKGFDKLPSHLGFMLSEVPKWFSKSALWRDNYKELSDVMDPDGERKGTPTPFQKMSTTRWLVRGKIVFNTLHFEELKIYFTCADPTGRPDTRY